MAGLAPWALLRVALRTMTGGASSRPEAYCSPVSWMRVSSRRKAAVCFWSFVIVVIARPLDWVSSPTRRVSAPIVRRMSAWRPPPGAGRSARRRISHANDAHTLAEISVPSSVIVGPPDLSHVLPLFPDPGIAFPLSSLSGLAGTEPPPPEVLIGPAPACQDGPGHTISGRGSPSPGRNSDHAWARSMLRSLPNPVPSAGAGRRLAAKPRS
jgi:hypothetical protein